MKRIGIIGAGRFGSSLAESLAESGVEILMIDRNRDAIQEFSSFIPNAVTGDACNEHTLEDAGFQECDAVVVAIGSNIEASTMATANCKELGIPKVFAKASSELHGRILQRIGADHVIYPDRDSAHRLARTLVSKGTVDLFEISDGFSIAEIDVPETLKNKSLAEAEVRKTYEVTVLCVRRLDEDPAKPRIVINPTPTEVIHSDDKLIVFGPNKKIDAIAQDV